jgi:tRNA-dihydrouridine synthase A
MIDPQWKPPAREDVVAQYAEYCAARLAEGHRLRTMVRHVQGLYAGLPNVRAWRRFLSEKSGQPSATAGLLIDALRIVEQAA